MLLLEWARRAGLVLAVKGKMYPKNVIIYSPSYSMLFHCVHDKPAFMFKTANAWKLYSSDEYNMEILVWSIHNVLHWNRFSVTWGWEKSLFFQVYLSVKVPYCIIFIWRFWRHSCFSDLFLFISILSWSLLHLFISTLSLSFFCNRSFSVNRPEFGFCLAGRLSALNTIFSLWFRERFFSSSPQAAVLPILQKDFKHWCVLRAWKNKPSTTHTWSWIICSIECVSYWVSLILCYK